MTGDWQGSWTAALDELELDVARVETMLRHEHRTNEEYPSAIPWQPPAELGEMPPEFEPRAADILARQLRAAQTLARRLIANRQQFAMTSRIETGERVKRPIYLDRAM